MSDATVSINQNSPVCLPKKRPGNLKESPGPAVDPSRRLVAAVVLQAIRDAYYPRKQTSLLDQRTAKEWLSSDIGQHLLNSALGRS
jgi:hypothetical protein